MTPWDEAAVERAARAIEETIDGARGLLVQPKPDDIATAALNAAISPELRKLMEAAMRIGAPDHDNGTEQGMLASMRLYDTALAFARSVRAGREG